MLSASRLLLPIAALVPALVLAGCGSQPERADVREALVTQILDDPEEVSQRVAEETAECILDRHYDNFEGETLQSVIEAGEIENLEERVELLEASRECSREASDAERADLPVPSEDELRAGMIEFMPTVYGGVTPTEAQVEELVDCWLTELDGALDDDTKRAWADGTSGHSMDLAEDVDAAQQTCGESILAG